MEKFEIIITTLFGLESLVAREVRRLGYETTSVEDGRVTFMGDNEAVCRANMWIRTGERVLIKTAELLWSRLTNCLKRQKLLIGVNGLAKMTLSL